MRMRQALTCLVLLVVGLGLSRRLVVCTQPCCGGHVKLAPSCDGTDSPAPHASAPACHCCQHAGREGPRRGEERGAVRPGCAGCVHVSLGVDLGLPPLATAPDVGTTAVIALASLPPRWTEVDAVPTTHPMATGPPRCDRRTAILKTTILRL